MTPLEKALGIQLPPDYREVLPRLLEVNATEAMYSFSIPSAARNLWPML